MGPQALSAPPWRTDRLIVLSRVRAALRRAGISNMLGWINLSTEQRDAFEHEARNLSDGGSIGEHPPVLDALFAPPDTVDWTVTEVGEDVRALTITYRVGWEADARGERLAWAAVRRVTRGGHSGPV
jgi:hypothetical protein